jgi:hypothetical protein
VSTHDHDTPPQSAPAADPAPTRWSTGHTVAAAVVAVGVFASGGVAWAARDPAGATTGPGTVGPGGFGQQPGQQPGQLPGQLPGPGQLGGPGQPPGQLTPNDDGGVDT